MVKMYKLLVILFLHNWRRFYQPYGEDVQASGSPLLTQLNIFSPAIWWRCTNFWLSSSYTIEDDFTSHMVKMYKLLVLLFLHNWRYFHQPYGEDVQTSDYPLLTQLKTISPAIWWRCTSFWFSSSYTIEDIFTSHMVKMYKLLIILFLHNWRRFHQPYGEDVQASGSPLLTQLKIFSPAIWWRCTNFWLSSSYTIEDDFTSHMVKMYKLLVLLFLHNWRYFQQPYGEDVQTSYYPLLTQLKTISPAIWWRWWITDSSSEE